MRPPAIEWYHPAWFSPPHGITHPEKYEELCWEFRHHGWAKGTPALIAYPWRQPFAGLLMPGESTPRPNTSHSYQYLYSIWGTEEWINLLANPQRVQ